MSTKTEKTANKELRDRVEQQLDWEPEVTSTDIGVAADEGVVTLTGWVEAYTEKLAAERAAKKTFGVRAVANDIVVKPLSQVTDTDIAASALRVLEARSDVPNKKIKTIVKDGVVYLEGELEWKYQKNSAERAVAPLLGVKAVVNQIEIKPKATTSGVKEKIENHLNVIP